MTLYVRTPMSIRPAYRAAPLPEQRVSFPIDLREEPEAYVLTALLPGVEAEALEIEIKKDTVKIQGEFEHGRDEDANYLMVERPAGPFSRKLVLDSPLDSDAADASLRNGILTLRIPKAKEALPRTIKVNTK